MAESLHEVIRMGLKKETISEKELMLKIKEFLDKEKTEYPNFALTTMMVDALTSGTSIFRVTKDASLKTAIQENFVEI